MTNQRADFQTPHSPPLNSLDELRIHGLWDANKPLRLHLGCGEKILPGYINIDYPNSEHNVMTIEPDVHADILALTFPPESVDEIRLEHVFEHFSRVTALAMLIRWQQWLKVGGVLHLTTPDLVGSAQNILTSKSFEIKMGNVRHLAGDQAASWAYHVDHWFEERYHTTLSHLGFSEISTSTDKWDRPPYLSNVTAKAKKNSRLNETELLRRAEELLWQSTVDPAERPTYEVWCKQLRALVAQVDTPPAPSNTTPACLEEMVELSKSIQSVNASQDLSEIHDFNQRSRDRWVTAKARALPAGTKILDVGAGTCPYRHLFSHCDYRTHDFKQYEGEKLGGTKEYGKIDYVSDITAIPLPDAAMDAVICTEVLEHVPEPIAAMQEMARLVRPGGKILVTAPLGSGLHQKPFHFYGGYTPYWYSMVAGRFGLTISEIKANHGLLAHFAQTSARVAGLVSNHPGLPMEHRKNLGDFFYRTLPQFLFSMDPVMLDEDFTVGYFVEFTKLSS